MFKYVKNNKIGGFNDFVVRKILLILFLVRYQMDLCKKALEENVVVYLGTGCGKTHIAVLLIYEMGQLIRKPQKNICVFLAPTVALVQQVFFFLIFLDR